MWERWDDEIWRGERNTTEWKNFSTEQPWQKLSITHMGFRIWSFTLALRLFSCLCFMIIPFLPFSFTFSFSFLLISPFIPSSKSFFPSILHKSPFLFLTLTSFLHLTLPCSTSISQTLLQAPCSPIISSWKPNKFTSKTEFFSSFWCLWFLYVKYHGSNFIALWL